MPGRLGTLQELLCAVLGVLTMLGDLREHAFPITRADHVLAQGKRVNTERTEYGEGTKDARPTSDTSMISKRSSQCPHHPR